jgi:hypothetical protein
MDQEEERPLVLAAFLCEKLLQENDGSFSAIRIVDRYTVHKPPEYSTRKLPPHQATITMFLMIRAGKVRGKHDFRVVTRPPAGTEYMDPTASFSIECVNDHEGLNIIFNMNLQFKEERPGLYWFDVIFDNRVVITSVPLTILYALERTGAELQQDLAQSSG